MKIGILTITPNIGFGGILQAYALQQTLEELSSSPVEIINYRYKQSLYSCLKFFIRKLARLVFRREYVKFTMSGDYKYRSQRIRDFHEQYLHYSSRVSKGCSFRDYVNKEYDVIVVGSDQVWRPAYVYSIFDYYLKGIKKSVKKVAYAASFGVDNWEYTKEETEECIKLIADFDYVSVRENSALKLLKENLKYQHEVYWDLDPTLLASPSIYKPLITCSPKDVPYVFTYILNKNPSKNKVVQRVCASLGVDVFDFNTGAEDVQKPLKERIAPTIQEWISGIAYSDFVVTDSFHGCVFSIILNKPFLVYVNKERGASRFVSILSLLGLKNRMIYSLDEFSEAMIVSPINWNNVNAKIFEQREVILSRLKQVFKK